MRILGSFSGINLEALFAPEPTGEYDATRKADALATAMEADFRAWLLERYGNGREVKIHPGLTAIVSAHDVGDSECCIDPADLREIREDEERAARRRDGIRAKTWPAGWSWGQ